MFADTRREHFGELMMMPVPLADDLRIRESDCALLALVHILQLSQVSLLVLLAKKTVHHLCRHLIEQELLTVVL